MHFPAAANEQWPKTMHDSCEHSVEKYRPAERDFYSRAKHLHGKRVEQDAGKKRQREHQRKRQCYRAVKHDHGHDVNVRIVHPRERRNKKFCDLRDQDKHQQYKKENHFRPITTKTSSKCDMSTAGASCACPSSSRTRKLFTVPVSRPDGKTPPT